jgi:ATP-dependent DNA helicase PIF1
LIQAIEAWFVLLHRRQELVITTATGTAAVKIGGTTLHSAVGIVVTEMDARNKSLSPAKLALWAERQYLIVDEISMMDSLVLMKLNTNLCEIKSNMNRTFGGVNVIFLGDFLQLPSVRKLDLYKNMRSHPYGRILWRSLNMVVILKQQMRQSDDPRYATLLRNLRLRQPTQDDINLLNSRMGVIL